MKTIIIAIRDQKADAFTQPFTAANKAIALRSWASNLNNPENRGSDQVKYPNDFSLWHIGNYDDNTGTLEPVAHTQIAIASELIEVK